ncbi:DnaD domain-containing protein [Brevibacillus sp. DP1.3A]|uniref:DnaD domain-containing protein n=1 Tax=Brevibacillus sp. DP1.3A TaxID=2738867 RepID=UPI00156AB2C2|nr:DnaD domain protein [Brevibacillus sp. DP1.3A]UED78086.1 DnaD domain protein [Brevibacillus sp. DP1.3A]
MASYRQLQTSFWQDTFVLDLTPEEKYFFIYLMTNSKTTQCGIYELPKRIAETETGYNRETVEKLLKRFEEYGKIRYSEVTKEIMILNWIKYNWINSPKVKACIKKELKKVKNREFVDSFLDQCDRYGYHIDTLSIDLGEEEEKEKEEEQEVEEKKEQEQEEKHAQANDDNPFLVYQKEIGVVSPLIAEDISKWIDENTFDEAKQIIIEAIKIAVISGVPKWKYATKILEDWARRGLRTLQEVKAYQVEFDNKRSQNSNSSGNPGGRTILKDSLPEGVQWQLEQEKKQTSNPPSDAKSIADFPDLQKRLTEMRRKRGSSDESPNDPR